MTTVHSVHLVHRSTLPPITQPSITAAAIDEVLQRLAALKSADLPEEIAHDGLRCAFGGTMRCDDHARMPPQRARSRERLGLEYVEGGGVKLSCLERCDNVGFDLQAAAPGIDQNGTREPVVPAAPRQLGQ